MEENKSKTLANGGYMECEDDDDSWKMQGIASEMTRWNIDILAIQEIRWLGHGILNKTGYSVIYSGPKQRTGFFGTDVMITKKVRDSLIDYKTAYDRMCEMRVKGRLRNITVLSVYAPTKEREQIEKERFYDKIYEICGSRSRYDIMVLVVEV